MRLLIARHAEDVGSTFVEEERGLTQNGVEQAKKLGLIAKDFNPTHLYCSPLLRSKQTAEIVSDFCDSKPIVLESIREQISRIPEINNVTQFMNNGYVEFNQRYLEGESYGELFTRAKITWQKIQKDHEINARIVLITHGRFMTFLIAVILGFVPDGFFLAIENTAYVIINILENWRPMLVLPEPNKIYV
ncbi:MAG: histidine phosphatase family protein [Candidatus Heimdallarchaeaceae archaeon]